MSSLPLAPASPSSHPEPLSENVMTVRKWLTTEAKADPWKEWTLFPPTVPLETNKEIWFVWRRTEREANISAAFFRALAPLGLAFFLPVREGMINEQQHFAVQIGVDTAQLDEPAVFPKPESKTSPEQQITN